MSKTAVLDQGRVAYLDRGEGEPVVFVHGLLVDGRLWIDAADHLASAGFRCLVPDWPMGSHKAAMGRDADLSPTGMAAIIVAFMDSLGLERATIVGNDSGGAISQILTAHHPERVERLVLTNCDTFEHFPPSLFKPMPVIARLPGGTTALTAPFRLGGLARATYGLLAKRPIPPELVADWLAPSLRDPGVKRDAGKFTAGMHKRYTLEAAERLRSFDRPVRFIWAPADRFFKIAHAERLAAMVPDARIERVEDARTFVPFDQPERVAELIAEFARA